VHASDGLGRNVEIEFGPLILETDRVIRLHLDGSVRIARFRNGEANAQEIGEVDQRQSQKKKNNAAFKCAHGPLNIVAPRTDRRASKRLDTIRTEMYALVLMLWVGAAINGADLDKARNAQDRPALDRMAAEATAAAQKSPNDAAAQYKAALAESYVAEVAIEVRDKGQAHSAAETGIKIAEHAVALKPDNAEYHRVYGTLCGQAISANVLQGMKYGHCAQDEVNKAVQLDPKSAINYVSRGVGYFYLPAGLGGGVELAVKDFQKAVEIDPQSADARVWLGLALRKENHNAEARREFQKAVELKPSRAWAKQQLGKTPAQ